MLTRPLPHRLVEVHNVFQSTDGEITVVGVYVEVDTGSTATKRACATKRSRITGAKAKYSESANATNESSTQAAVSSSMLETLFGSVEQIAEAGAVVTSGALVFSDYVEALTSGQFQS
jgi:hypothetical protein